MVGEGQAVFFSRSIRDGLINAQMSELGRLSSWEGRPPPWPLFCDTGRNRIALLLRPEHLSSCNPWDGYDMVVPLLLGSHADVSRGLRFPEIEGQLAAYKSSVSCGSRRMAKRQL